jgi:hypothetical protein
MGKRMIRKSASLRKKGNPNRAAQRKKPVGRSRRADLLHDTPEGVR